MHGQSDVRRVITYWRDYCRHSLTTIHRWRMVSFKSSKSKTSWFLL